LEFFVQDHHKRTYLGYLYGNSFECS
jgi:hypothetical protein